MSEAKDTPQARPMQYRGADPRYADAHLETQCVHAGECWEKPDFWTPTVPIYNSIVCFYDRVQDLDDMIFHKRTGYGYSRWASPTNTALERALSTLEGADRTLVCASGMAAIHLALLGAGAGAGATVLSSNSLYGPAFNLIKEVLPSLGARTIMADFMDLERVEDLLRCERPGIVYFEVMTNPLVHLIDAPAVVELAHRYGARVIIDNTFTTPYLFKPLEAGADFVCESVSKYLGGHDDLLAGAVGFREADFERLHGLSVLVGGTLGANEAWLALRGLKTFALRIERQCDNAMEVARFLESHPLVSRVSYPGLPSHPQHATATRILRGGRYGGMLSFDLRDGTQERAFRFIDALRLVLPTGSLGEVNSLIVYPARTTHHMVSEAEMNAMGITVATLRMSTGIENVDDLKADLDQALRKSA